MTADETRMKAAFIQWDIPPKKQENLCLASEHGDAARMDARQIVFTALEDAAEAIWYGTELTYYKAEDPLNLMTFKKADFGPYETVSVDRKALIKILENMDSDFVRFKVSTDAPLRLLGEIGETPAGAAIAPRIDCKEGEEDETDSL